MLKIKGNTYLQFKAITSSKSLYGEDVEEYSDYLAPIKGFLDLSSGNSNYSTFNTKIQESTHVFLCDYVDVPAAANQLRCEVNGRQFDVLYIDNPQERNYHLEIYLKAVEG